MNIMGKVVHPVGGAPAAVVGFQHDYILVDRSGSMANKWSDTLGGVNAYVHGLAANDATKDILVTVALFDVPVGVSQSVAGSASFDLVRRSVAARAWADISRGEAFPRGHTPLYDAVGRLVVMAREDAPAKSAIVIVTDGFENASREHTNASARALLDDCRGRGWQVIFLGSDFDNAHQSAGLGNAAAQTMSMDSHNTVEVMQDSAQKRALYSATGKSMSYSAEDKKRGGRAWS